MCPSSKDASAGRPAPEEGGIGRGASAYAFRFVEVGEPSQGKDEEARSVIRSHVMRDFYGRRNRPKVTSQPQAMSAGSNKEGVEQQIHRFKVGPEGLREVKRGRKKTRKLQKLDSLPRVAVEAVDPDVYTRGPGDKSHNEAAINIATGRRGQLINHPVFLYEQNSASDTNPIALEGDVPSMRAPSGNTTAELGYVPAGAGPIDPFDTLPQIKDPRTQVLLYHGKHQLLCRL